MTRTQSTANSTVSAAPRAARSPAKPLKTAATSQPFTAEGGAIWARRWLIFGGLAAAALCVVLFVANVLRVSKLTEDIERLKKDHERLTHQNELFRSEIIRLQAPERITRIARSKIGMVSASSAPKTITAPEKSE